jgi:hypothetical protein
VFDDLGSQCKTKRDRGQLRLRVVPLGSERIVTGRDGEATACGACSTQAKASEGHGSQTRQQHHVLRWWGRAQRPLMSPHCSVSGS